MRVLLQRVSKASVTADEVVIGRIDHGLLLLIGFGQGDSEEILRPMAEKIVNLRIFADADGRFDKSLLDVEGEILAVSQFTLYGDASKGRRPEFSQALQPAAASKLFDTFVSLLKESGAKDVQTGEFGAYMQVALLNDGPVTMMLEK